jgi:hypothetical protein
MLFNTTFNNNVLPIIVESGVKKHNPSLLLLKVVLKTLTLAHYC